jgi:hypothetical protein
LLANKHKTIASKLFEVLERKSKEYAEHIIEEFNSMFGRLIIPPRDIEGLAEMREYIATLQQRIDLQSPLVRLYIYIYLFIFIIFFWVGNN